ncbi:MAG: ABC transporter substrate-binding protein, partial [Acidimicrobiales bacterium]
MKRRWVAPLLALGVGIMSACAGGEASAPSDGGTTVEIFGPFRGVEAELLAASLEPFEETTGIDIRYTGTGAFIPDLEAQRRAADPPDIALIPQPGVVAELAASGELAPLSAETLAGLDMNYSDQARALADVDGIATGVPFQLSLKSLVWYRPDVFEQHGLTVPQTLGELTALVEELQAEGVTPWCLGIEAQAATGWVATDWTEEMVLRLAGPETYDAWIEGVTEFADSSIAESYEAFREIALVPGRSAGGIPGILRTSHQTSPLGLFGDSPECLMHRQGSFVINSMPPDLEFGPEGDIHFFEFPGMSADEAAPLLVGSVLAVAFDDRPEVAAVMTHLADPSST